MISKFNEFVDNSFSNKIISLIEDSENVNISDPEIISQNDSYRQVVSFGEKSIPYIVERGKYLWNIALMEITGIEPIGKKSSEIVNFWKNWAKENGY